MRLRHANGYETLYGHLSRIAVRAGQRIEQGTLVGAVGATGLATGPHLDYRMARNGQFLDPLKVALPPADPIAPSEREAFSRSCRELLALLDQATAPDPLGFARRGSGGPLEHFPGIAFRCRRGRA